MRALMRHIKSVISAVIYNLTHDTTNVALVGLLPNFAGRVGGIEFNDDYSRIYIASDSVPSYIYQCEMGTAGDIHTMTYTSRVNVLSSTLFLTRSKLTNKFYSGRGLMREYEMTNPNDISTAVYTGKQVTLSTNAVFGVFFNDDESKLFTWEHVTYRIKEYALSTPGDITTAVYTGNLIQYVGYTRGITIAENGTKILFWLQSGVKALTIITLATAWDLTSYTVSYGTQDYLIYGEEIEISETLGKIYTSQTTNLVQFSIN